MRVFGIVAILALVGLAWGEETGVKAPSDSEKATEAPLTPTKNDKCDACHAVTYELYQAIQVATKRATNKGGMVQLPYAEILKLLCVEMKQDRHRYGPLIMEHCTTMTDEMREDLVSIYFAYTDEQFDNTNYYKRKQKFCGKFPPRDCLPKDTPKGELTQCAACKLLAEDTVRRVRWGRGKPGYMSAKHVGATLKDMCENTEVRFDPAHDDVMSEVCEGLLEDHYRGIVNYISSNKQKEKPIAQHMCVSLGGFCKKTDFLQAPMKDEL